MQTSGYVTDTFFIDQNKLDPRPNCLYLEVSHDVLSWIDHPIMMALPAESLGILEQMHRDTLEPGSPCCVGGWDEHFLDGQLLIALPFGGVRNVSTGMHYPSVGSSEERLLWAKSWKRLHGNPWGHYDGRPLLPITQVRATCAKEVSVARNGLVTLRWASNALGDYRFIKPALFRIGDWPATALKHSAAAIVVHRTRRLGLPFRAPLRAGLLQLKEGWIGVEISQTLPEWADSPIVAAIAKESLALLAEYEGRELPGVTLLTVSHRREYENEGQWGSYGPFQLTPFDDSLFPLRRKTLRWNDGSFTLEWENFGDLEVGPCIVSNAIFELSIKGLEL